jgi:hypothetical protein
MKFLLKNHCGTIRAFPACEKSKDFMLIRTPFGIKQTKSLTLRLRKETLDYLKAIERLTNEKVHFYGEICVDDSSKSTKITKSAAEYLNKYGFPLQELRDGN